MKKKIKNTFLTGIIAIIPVGVTIYILYLIVGLVRKLVGIFPPQFHPDNFLPFHIPGFNIMLTVVLIFCVGLVTKSYLGNMIVDLGERIVDKIPLVRSIYRAVKQLADALLSDKGESFKRVVLIEYPRNGLYSLAFVTGQSRGEVQRKTEKHHINVFVPTTPNPTSGFYIMVPETEVIPLDMSVEEAFTLLISGGIISPPERQEQKVLKSKNSQ